MHPELHAGGQKGLWLSHSRPNDRRLVLAESAIDALSHAALFPDAEDQTRYASLGGKPNFKQPGLLQATIARLPQRSEIVAAFDADEAGRLLVDVLRLAVAGVAEMGRADLTRGWRAARQGCFAAVAGERIEIQENDLSLPNVRPAKPYLQVRYWRQGVRLTREDGERLVRDLMGQDWMPPV